MALYMVQATYSEKGTARLVENPQNRAEAIKPVIERLGGTLLHVWHSLGEYDAIAIIDMPDNASAVAFSIAAEAAGGVRAFKTTPLMTVEEGISAMKKAKESGYHPPE
jgi:uncharacterized protein with GYD domain